MDIILKIWLAFLAALMCLCIVILIKNEITCRRRLDIADAIFRYQIDCFYNNVCELVNYEDMESYDNTLYRLWDWSNKRILPKEKFEIIKPYMK